MNAGMRECRNERMEKRLNVEVNNEKNLKIIAMTEKDIFVETLKKKN